jgi:hypothetical protein
MSEIDAISVEEVSQWKSYCASNKPLIIRNAARAWPAIRLWNISFLARALQKLQIQVRRSDGCSYPDLSGRHVVSSSKHFFGELEHFALHASYSRTWFAGGDFPYGGEEGFPLKPLVQDIQVPNFDHVEKIVLMGLWISTAGVRSWLHYDANGAHNINYQIAGKKDVYVVAPSFASKLRLYSFGSGKENFSRLSIRELSSNSIGSGAVVDVKSGHLDAGDAVYIPPFWMHSFDHLDRININLNFWFSNGAVIFSPIAIRSALLQVLKEHERVHGPQASSERSLICQLADRLLCGLNS